MAPPLLEALGITKAFGGVRALSGVSFDVRPGEVHALVGENGAGKSTLIKIMTGAETPDDGRLIVGGRAVERMDPAASRALGIAAIYQQPSLFPDLTVAENIAWSLETGSLWRRIDWRARQGTSRHASRPAGGASIDPARFGGTLTFPEQQLVEIARALGAARQDRRHGRADRCARRTEVATLFSVIRSLRDEGVGIIYISHRLERGLRDRRSRHRPPGRLDGGDMPMLVRSTARR